MADQNFRVKRGLEVGIGGTVITALSSGNVGLGTTNPTSKLWVNGDGYFTGVLTATTFYGDGSQLTGISAGIATYADNAGIATYATTAGIATYATTAGIVTYATYAGIATYATSAGIATYADNAGIATYADNAGIATYATTAGIVTYATYAGIATYAPNAGIATYADNAGIATYAPNAGIATDATKLQTPKTFEITGNFVTASAISFDGTGNVALAATIAPDSIALDTYTTGDYVKNISGTSNQITVTSGTGEGSTPTLSIPNQFTAPQDVTITRDLQVNRNLNVTGNITIGGTSATLFTTEFKVYDPDIVLGFRTDASNNDVSTDNTANHGGIAIASTEGTPLVQLYNVSIGETNPATYKKIMWFKSGSFSGLSTDAWLFNYGVGIGSTQFPTGTRLAAGSVQFTENDLAVVRNINASGVITASSFSGNASSASYATTAGIATYATTAGIATYATTAGVSTNVIGGIGSLTQLQVTGISTFTNGPVFIGAATSTGTALQRLQVTGGAYVSGNLGIGSTNPTSKLTVQGDVSIASTVGIGTVIDIIPYDTLNSGTLSWEGSAGQLFSITNNLTTGSIFSVNDVSGIPSIDVDANGTVSVVAYGGNLGVGTTNPTSKLHIVGNVLISGIATASNFVGNLTGTATTAGIATYATSSGIATYATSSGIATYATSSGIATYATTAGISTYATSSGISTYATSSGISTYATTAGVSTNVIGGIASLTQLQVTGISTFTNGPVLIGSGTSTGTASQLVQVTGGSYVSDNLGIGSTNPTSKLYVVGDGYFTGVLTATTFKGDGSQLTGISAGIATYADNAGIATYAPNAGISTYATNAGVSTSVIGGIGSLTQLQVTGVSTFTNGPVFIGAATSTGTASQPLQVTGGAYVSDNFGIGITNPTSKLYVVGDGYFTGVLTATTFYGDGSQLTGISASGGISISTNTTNQSQYINYATSFGSTTGLGATTLLVYNPSSGNLGIGTTNPTSTLQVEGNANISNTITAFQLDLTASGTANDSVLYLSGTPTSSSGTNGLLGIGQLNFSDTDIIANFVHSVNSYAQLVVQNKNSGSTSSADIVVNNDRTAGTTYFGDFGINGTTFAGGGPFGDPDGTYVYSSGGTLSLGSQGAYNVKIATNNTERITILSTGEVGIGTTNPTQALDVVGNIIASGTVTASSDEKLKTNIQTISNALEKVLSLRGVEYDRIDSLEHQIGLIAQEVEEIVPEVVYPKQPAPNYETKSIAYANLVGLLIEAIKEQNVRIEELERRLGGN